MRVKLFSPHLVSPFLVFGAVVPPLPPGEYADNGVSQVSGTNDLDGAGLDGTRSRLTTGPMAPGLSPAIDAADIARGYRFERSTVKGRISYEMPEGASPAGTWHLTVPTTTSCP